MFIWVSIIICLVGIVSFFRGLHAIKVSKKHSRVLHSKAIIVGYPGVGKSTMSRLSDNVVDLESSDWFIGARRADDWEVTYCNVAMNLAKQGNVVFTSSHDGIRNRLMVMTRGSDVKLLYCYPAPVLQADWILKLKCRFENTQSEKDRKAYLNAKECYEGSIRKMINEGVDSILITCMDYDLEDMVLQKLQK